MAFHPPSRPPPPPSREPPIDLESLALFVAVAETCSFTKGAARVYRTQPVASARVAQLEERLGLSLFERANRAIRLTRSGSTLYEYAKRMLQLRAEAWEAMTRRRGRLEGDLFVGASTIPAAYLVPGWAARFHRKHPRVRIRIGSASTEEVLRRVREGQHDLGVVGDRDSGRDLSFFPVASDEIVLALPRGHPLAAARGALDPRALKGLPFVMRLAGSGTRSFLERALKKAGVSARDFDVVCEVESTEAAREAVKRGVGISFVSNLAVAADVACRRLTVRRLAGCGLARPFYLVRPRGRKLTAAAHAFAEFVRAR